MSRQDHRNYDAALLKLRAEIAEERQGMRFSRKEFAVIVIATVLALAGLFVDEERVVFSFLSISWLAFVYICGTHTGSQRWRSVIALSITAGYVALALHVHSRTLEHQQDNVWQKLTASASAPSSQDLSFSTFTVTNGGNTNIDKNHELACKAKLLVFTKNGVVRDSSFSQPQVIPFEIRPGGDSQSVACFANPNGTGTKIFAGILMRCADVTLSVDYALVTQPLERRNKQFRFVADESGGFVWHSQSIEMPGSPCEKFIAP